MRDTRSDSPVKKIYQHWNFGTLFMARGGMPLDVTFTRPVGSQLYPTRPDLAEDSSLLVKNAHQPGGTMFNYRAFLIPSGFRQGTLARNALRGDGAWQADLAMQRDFRLKEQLSLRVRSEFFNALNHPNFGAPDISLGTYADGSLARNSNFGRITRMLNTQLGGLQQAYQMGGPRSIQASMKLLF